ncbi:MAG: hypothetical protein EKK53_14120 [Burkholderiales bacterium]|nr:MAG: hypothetical protein EKK53_14120 [Burkholderiales bacterium]
MTDLNRAARRWAGLAALATLPLVAPAPGIAQTPAPAPAPAPTTAAERAQRDAERVFEFIKFHTLRPKTIEPPRPARAPSPATAPAPTPAASAERASPAARPAPADAPAKPTASLPASTAPTTPPPPAATPVAPSVAAPVVVPITAPEAAPPPPLTTVPAPAQAPATATDDDEADDAALQLQSFVAPVLPPAVQATLGAGARNVKVRFTVEADGRVSQAEAAATVPRRLAKPAVDAILQWRFAPLPQPRTVEVEIAFRRD